MSRHPRHAAEATLNAVIGEIRSRFLCVQGLLGAQCQTGEPYAVVGEAQHESAIAGTVDEGADSVLYASPDDAVEGFFRAFTHYSRDREGILFWRYMHPHAQIHDGICRRELVWKVRCRLIITSCPMIWCDQGAYDAARGIKSEPYRVSADGKTNVIQP